MPPASRAPQPLPQFSNFLTDERGVNVFRNVVQMTKRRVRVVADVAYTPPIAGSDQPPSRLTSSISAAGVEVRLGQRFGWSPFRVPLPLKGEGWLDVTYLSDEMRITRGNRGGVFVHLRPRLLTRQAAEK